MFKMAPKAQNQANTTWKSWTMLTILVTILTILLCFLTILVTEFLIDYTDHHGYPGDYPGNYSSYELSQFDRYYGCLNFVSNIRGVKSLFQFSESPKLSKGENDHS